ncbi:pentapeptide repeat-containing protein [Chitinophaga sp. Ak27]|uniref:pentapeptide repeat-containing protein n=1 Tax=Chitinophaga sp. Ak27 TaxID=2726116 RepID=UPI00145D4A12|nr:pentapeptide repeat-containing protein [Chitinophaga sp. Ak27]NLU91935.1 pentapeptide repeat-containing protein [Chitinophaga sp. Ak27]
MKRWKIKLSGSILVVYCTLLLSGMKGTAQTPYSCSSCDLHGKDFSGQDLTNANLSFANLDNANFTNCKLNGAMFANASVKGARFNNAQLNISDKGPANFSNADCRSADFTGASLQGAVFTYANMSATNFNRTDLTDALFGLRLEIRDSLNPQPPSFEKTVLPCSLKPFFPGADPDKVKFFPCKTPISRKAQKSGKASTDTVYLSLRGTDDNSCGTADHPCKTFKTAIEKAPDNGVVAVSYGKFYPFSIIISKNLTFVGGLDNQWQPTGGQTWVGSSELGLPVFIIDKQVNVSFEYFILNAAPHSTRIATTVLQAFTGSTVTLSNVNLNGAVAADGENGTAGTMSCCLMCHGNDYASCGDGGAANSNVKGTPGVIPFGWFGTSGGNGGTGSSSDCYLQCAGGGGAQGGSSFCVVLLDARLVVDITDKFDIAGGGNGGNGGYGAYSAGGGAGGNGGLAAGVVLAGNAAITGTPIYYGGVAGKPGDGGPSSSNPNKNCSGKSGQPGLPGITAETIQY